MTPRWCGYRVLSGRGPEGECGGGPSVLISTADREERA